MAARVVAPVAGDVLVERADVADDRGAEHPLAEGGAGDGGVEAVDHLNEPPGEPDDRGVVERISPPSSPGAPRADAGEDARQAGTGPRPGKNHVGGKGDDAIRGPLGHQIVEGPPVGGQGQAAVKPAGRRATFPRAPVGGIEEPQVYRIGLELPAHQTRETARARRGATGPTGTTPTTTATTTPTGTTTATTSTTTAAGCSASSATPSPTRTRPTVRRGGDGLTAPRGTVRSLDPQVPGSAASTTRWQLRYGTSHRRRRAPTTSRTFPGHQPGRTTPA